MHVEGLPSPPAVACPLTVRGRASYSQAGPLKLRRRSYRRPGSVSSPLPHTTPYLYRTRGALLLRMGAPCRSRLHGTLSPSLGHQQNSANMKQERRIRKSSKYCNSVCRCVWFHFKNE